MTKLHQDAYRKLIGQLLYPKIERDTNTDKWMINGEEPNPVKYSAYLLKLMEKAVHEIQDSSRAYNEKMDLLNDLAWLKAQIHTCLELFRLKQTNYNQQESIATVKECLQLHEVIFNVFLNAIQANIDIITNLSREELKLAAPRGTSTIENPLGFFVNLLQGDGMLEYTWVFEKTLSDDIELATVSYNQDTNELILGYANIEDFHPELDVERALYEELDRQCLKTMEIVRQNVEAFGAQITAIPAYITKQLILLKQLANAKKFNNKAARFPVIIEKLRKLGGSIIDIYDTYLDKKDIDSFYKTFNEIPHYQKLQWNGTLIEFAEIFKDMIKEGKINYRGESKMAPIVTELNKLFCIKKAHGKGFIDEITLQTAFKRSVTKD